MNTATTYEIRVAGHLDDHWSTWLGAVDLARSEDGTTALAFNVADQAQLHGILVRLRDIGIVLIELHSTSSPPPGPNEAVTIAER